jgi:hypothetical protein
MTTSTNDTKIKTLLQTIENKNKEIGERPKAHWETNGVLPVANGININTINSVDRCIEIAAQLIMQKGSYEQACIFLGIKDTNSLGINLLNEYLNDLKLKVKIIQWDTEKKKIQAFEKKLKDLRSEDLKTEEILSDIASDLDL